MGNGSQQLLARLLRSKTQRTELSSVLFLTWTEKTQTELLMQLARHVLIQLFTFFLKNTPHQHFLLSFRLLNLGRKPPPRSALHSSANGSKSATRTRMSLDESCARSKGSRLPRPKARSATVPVSLSGSQRRPGGLMAMSSPLQSEDGK